METGYLYDLIMGFLQSCLYSIFGYYLSRWGRRVLRRKHRTVAQMYKNTAASTAKNALETNIAANNENSDRRVCKFQITTIDWNAWMEILENLRAMGLNAKEAFYLGGNYAKPQEPSKNIYGFYISCHDMNKAHSIFSKFFHNKLTLPLSNYQIRDAVTA